MSTNYQELTLANDFVFSKVMRNPELCKKLLEIILKVKIKKIEYINYQETIELKSNGKGIRLDIYVEDDGDVTYNIEMQTAKKKELPKRTRYYQGMIDLNLINKGEVYTKLKKSFVIFICTFAPFDKSLPVYTFSKRCKEDNSVMLEDEANIVILNTTAAENADNEELKNFMRYVSDGIVSDDFTQELQDAVVNAKNNEEWRVEYMTLYARDAEMREEGQEMMCYKLIQKGKLTIQDAAEELGQTVEEVAKRMRESGFKVPTSV